MFRKKPNLEEELKKYTAVLIHLSIKQAEELEKEYGLRGNEFNDVSMQIIGFCIINLMRTFRANGISPEKSRTAVDSILQNIALVLADANNDDQEAVYRNVNKTIGGLVSEYGKLPLKNDDPGKGEKGTLLWEYGKFMTFTIRKDPSSDVIVIMKCISLITNVNKVLVTDHIIKALK